VQHALLMTARIAASSNVFPICSSYAPDERIHATRSQLVLALGSQQVACRRLRNRLVATGWPRWGWLEPPDDNRRVLAVSPRAPALILKEGISDMTDKAKRLFYRAPLTS
jgi:hypothetical protein